MNRHALAKQKPNMNTNLDKQFIAIVDNNGRALQAFIRLLEQEKELLTKKDYKGYQKLVSQKQIALQNLSKLESEMAALMQPLGLEFNKTAIDTLLGYMPEAVKKPLHNKWRVMLKLLAKCEQLNQVNQKMVYHMKQSNDRLISLIKGETMHSKTYSASGKANMYSSNERCLARA